MTRLFNGESMMPVSDLYKWALSQLEQGRFTEKQKIAVLENLQDYAWVKPLISGLSQKDLIKMHNSVLSDFKNGILPHAMGWSIIYYYFTQAGINTSEMKQVINTSQILKETVESTTYNNSIWTN